ncbi:DnaA regulatory inactivator Hda [Pseudocolwellia agarivorans]|uniref:DnaA regulatory inactivator Hda n=1 Tax=Pseudocolwellia agarivorans TaxID=1911682 RepID=UPI000984741A|nr:DnaA regulatory inactivator Hda [Pseudocolwellia agarivorans]
MKYPSQLSLSVQLPDDETFQSFQSQNNHAVVIQLQQFIDLVLKQEAHPTALYLFGIQGVGKSHLLHASCAYAEGLGLSSLSLSFSELAQLSIEMFDGLEQIDVICLDDIHLIAGNDEFERAVFDLFNRVTEQGKCLIISGDQNVSNLNIQLPDLLSRLSWGLTEQVKPIDDNEKILALQYRAEQRGLILANDSAKFLLTRLSREMSNLINALDELDKASIREQRKITIPFIKEIFHHISS